MPRKIFLFMLTLIILIAGISCNPQDILEPDDENDTTETENNDEEQQPDVKMRPTVFYLPDENGKFVVPISKQIPWVEGIARATLEHMIESEASRRFLAGTGLKAPFPAGTAIKGINIKDGLCKVDFSKEFLNYPREEERLVVSSLLYTLTEFSTIDRVELQVEGVKMTALPGGTALGEIIERDRGINLEVAEGLNDFRRVNRVIIYYNTRLGEAQLHYYVPVTRIIPKSDNLAKASVEELLKGPRQGVPLYSALPEASQVLDLIVREETAIVDFSAELLDFRGGTEAAENLLNQIVLTLTELPEVREVQIFVAGESVILEGGISLSAKNLRPARINLAE